MSSSGPAELGRRLVERAYLEGDFVLRSGRRSRYYLDKYRFETDPALLAGLGRELAALVRAHAPQAELLAGPELGAVPLAAVTSIETGLPYVIVRKEAKEYGTGNRLEGVHEPGDARLRGRGCGHIGRRAALRDRGAAERGSRRFCCNFGGRPRRRAGPRRSPRREWPIPPSSPSSRSVCDPRRKRPESGSGRAIVAVRRR